MVTSTAWITSSLTTVARHGVNLEYLKLRLLYLFKNLHPTLRNPVFCDLNCPEKNPKERQTQKPISLGRVEVRPRHPQPWNRNSYHENPYSHHSPPLLAQCFIVLLQKRFHSLL